MAEVKYKGNVDKWLMARGVKVRMDFENLCYISAYSIDKLRSLRAYESIFSTYRGHLIKVNKNVAVSTLYPMLRRLMGSIRSTTKSDYYFSQFTSVVYIMNQWVIDSNRNLSVTRANKAENLIHNFIFKDILMIVPTLRNWNEMISILINTLKIKITYI